MSGEQKQIVYLLDQNFGFRLSYIKFIYLFLFRKNTKDIINDYFLVKCEEPIRNTKCVII